MGVKIVGLDELDEFLRTSPSEIANGPVRKGLQAGAAVMQAALAEAAPELMEPESPGSDALPPGALKSDIEVHVYVAQGGGSAVIGPGKYTEHVARWVEYGHAMVRGGYSRVITNRWFADGKLRRGPGKVVGNVPAYPWIRPTVEATMEKALAAAYDVFGKEIIKIANRKVRRSAGTPGRAA